MVGQPFQVCLVNISHICREVKLINPSACMFHFKSLRFKRIQTAVKKLPAVSVKVILLVLALTDGTLTLPLRKAFTLSNPG